ncbi:MAG: aldo/keto reductase [Bryobacterales bacterium]|nr:aldo/keto reductase [Bryobacterales bacterium]
MRIVTLGGTGIRCGRIGLGCATFGREISEEESFRIMDHAVEQGITLFDTAEAYGGGQARHYRKNYLGMDDEREVSGELHSSEKIIGRWLRSRGARDEITLLTKVTTNFTVEHVREAITASLERLQTDRIDLYLYHQYDANTAGTVEAAEAMDAVVKSGQARFAGCSNYSSAQLEASLATSREKGLARFEVIESNYNLAIRDIEADVLPLTQREAIGVITYSPLGAGFLTGKYTGDRNAFPKGTRFDVIPGHADVYFSGRNFRVVEDLRAMSERTGVSVVQLAMSFVFQNPAIDVVLVGARHCGHLDNAIQALNQPVPEELVTEMRSW